MADPLWGNVTLLLHFDQTVGTSNTIDSSLFARTVTPVGSPVVSATNPMFGAGSANSATNGARFDINGAIPGGLGNADFTAECWVRYVSGSGLGTYFGLDGFVNTSYGGLGFCSNGLYGSYTGTSWNVSPSGTYTLTDGNWHHIAISRVGVNMYVFQDGTLRATYNVGTNGFYTTAAGRISILPAAASSAANVFVDEFRFTQGTGRYTTDFIPEGPFPEGFEETNTYDSRLEAIAYDDSFVVPGYVAAGPVAQQVMFVDMTQEIANYRVEVLAHDDSFVEPPIAGAVMVAQQMAFTIPFERTVNNSTLEVVGRGSLSNTVNGMVVEVIDREPYEVNVQNMSIEIVSLSSFIPAGANQRTTWFIEA